MGLVITSWVLYCCPLFWIPRPSKSFDNGFADQGLWDFGPTVTLFASRTEDNLPAVWPRGFRPKRGVNPPQKEPSEGRPGSSLLC